MWFSLDSDAMCGRADGRKGVRETQPAPKGNCLAVGGAIAGFLFPFLRARIM